jgi:hypothetical protein
VAVRDTLPKCTEVQRVPAVGQHHFIIETMSFTNIGSHAAVAPVAAGARPQAPGCRPAADQAAISCGKAAVRAQHHLGASLRHHAPCRAAQMPAHAAMRAPAASMATTVPETGSMAACIPPHEADTWPTSRVKLHSSPCAVQAIVSVVTQSYRGKPLHVRCVQTRPCGLW